MVWCYVTTCCVINSLHDGAKYIGWIIVAGSIFGISMEASILSEKKHNIKEDWDAVLIIIYYSGLLILGIASYVAFKIDNMEVLENTCWAILGGVIYGVIVAIAIGTATFLGALPDLSSYARIVCLLCWDGLIYYFFKVLRSYKHFRVIIDREGDLDDEI